MMKLITWFLLICFTSQAMASSVKAGLEAAMNDFEYEMVVEWDQKDAKKAEEFTKKFTDKLSALYQQGLSDSLMMEYIESRVKDKSQLATIKAAAALSAEGGSSPENIARAMRDNLDKFGDRGASWNGGVAMAGAIVGILAVTALIIYQLVWESTHRCAEAKWSEECGYEDVCTDWDYDSYEGTSYCEDWDTVYSCSDVEKCLRWEKYK